MTPTNSIIINGRFLDQAMTGVQRFARGISGAVDELVSERHPSVADLSVSVARPKSSTATFPFSHLVERRSGRLNGHAWEQLELPFHSKAPLMNLCNIAPLLGRNNLTVVHDANVWLIPDNYSRAFRAVYHVLLPLGIRRSRVWLTVSQYSADQLLSRRIADRKPNAIIGNGSDHMLALEGKRSRLAHFGLPQTFVFALGSRSRNKNIDLIREIAPALRYSGISTVIAGEANSKVFSGGSEGKGSGVIELGRVNDDDLAYLFHNCLCFLFPSFFEGFGIPPLEAMVMGAPVISSNTASMPEILGPAALYCAPDDPSAWIKSVLKLEEDAALRSSLIEKGRLRATNYTWRASAIGLLELARTMLVGGNN